MQSATVLFFAMMGVALVQANHYIDVSKRCAKTCGVSDSDWEDMSQGGNWKTTSELDCFAKCFIDGMEWREEDGVAVNLNKIVKLYPESKREAALATVQACKDNNETDRPFMECCTKNFLKTNQ